MSDSQEPSLDATGLYCPEPVFRTKMELERMQVGQTLKVSADDPAAEEDITRWASKSGHEILDTTREGAVVTIRIKKTR